MHVRPRLGNRESGLRQPTNSDARFYPTSAASRSRNLRPTSQRGLHIFFAHSFIGMVADAAGAAQKEHRRGHARGHHHGVVAGAAGHALLGQPRLRSPRQDRPSAAHPWARRVDPTGVCIAEPGRAAAAMASRLLEQRSPRRLCVRHRPRGARQGSHALRPRITLPAFGSTSTLPTVATSPSVCRASDSTATIHSAAPASASWRRCMGVVPA